MKKCYFRTFFALFYDITLRSIWYLKKSYFRRPYYYVTKSFRFWLILDFIRTIFIIKLVLSRNKWNEWKNMLILQAKVSKQCLFLIYRSFLFTDRFAHRGLLDITFGFIAGHTNQRCKGIELSFDHANSVLAEFTDEAT